MQFRVHVYPVVRVEFVVEAKSFEDAVTKVMEDDKTYEKLRQLEGFAEDYDDTVLVDKLNKKGERIADKDISLESLGL